MKIVYPRSGLLNIISDVVQKGFTLTCFDSRYTFRELKAERGIDVFSTALCYSTEPCVAGFGDKIGEVGQIGYQAQMLVFKPFDPQHKIIVMWEIDRFLFDRSFGDDIRVILAASPYIGLRE